MLIESTSAKVRTMVQPAAERHRRGGGRGLSRDVIVAAALRSIDARGTQGLSMRRLAQDLGVEAMSLYRYVTGREDILEAVVAGLLGGVNDSLDDQLSQTWQGYLQSLAHTVRTLALAHSRAFPLVATRHPQHRGFVLHCAASRWSSTFSARSKASASPISRWSASTVRSAVFCSASCCWRGSARRGDLTGRGAAG